MVLADDRADDHRDRRAWRGCHGTLEKRVDVVGQARDAKQGDRELGHTRCPPDPLMSHDSLERSRAADEVSRRGLQGVAPQDR